MLMMVRAVSRRWSLVCKWLGVNNKHHPPKLLNSNHRINSRPQAMAQLRQALAPRSDWSFLTARDEAALEPVLVDYGQDAVPLLVGHLQHVRQGAAHLEAAGVLEQFQLERDGRVGTERPLHRGAVPVPARRPAQPLAHGVASGLDLGPRRVTMGA